MYSVHSGFPPSSSSSPSSPPNASHQGYGHGEYGIANMPDLPPSEGAATRGADDASLHAAAYPPTRFMAAVLPARFGFGAAAGFAPGFDAGEALGAEPAETFAAA
ncbi:MAG: hypothetical protein KH142_08625 [Slackia piriformis]|uniref:Uncharacterized protein n=1 Tax=Slackia piriformis TaxID=626934 RepID=A0A943UUG2_9ACTN|nr:hypothetical protein [Slackia piriformis]